MIILVGDIGGTHTRLALASGKRGDWRIGGLQERATQQDLAPAIREYLAAANAPRIEAAAFCAAGPLGDDGSIPMTNVAALLEPGVLARAAGVERAVLINDFAAIAESLPALTSADLRPIGGGAAAPAAPRAVMGPGTGFGVAIATPAHGRWTVVAGEGGHADLAPVDDDELAAWRRLREQHGRVSSETVLCGPGLERLHAALHGPPRLDAAEIAERAWRGEAHCARTIAVFTRWLGSVAGNLALIAGARGGVYIAGGILPRWGENFDVARFRAAFEAKPPYRNWLAGIPSFLVTHPAPALLGLAELAASYTAEA